MIDKDLAKYKKWAVPLKDNGEEKEMEERNLQDKVEEVSPFKPYVDELLALLDKKNKDYKDSFNRTLKKWGENTGYARIDDKIERISNIVKTGEISVKDEPVEQTLWDIAGYAILMLRYLKEYKC